MRIAVILGCCFSAGAVCGWLALAPLMHWLVSSNGVVVVAGSPWEVILLTIEFTLCCGLLLAMVPVAMMLDQQGKSFMAARAAFYFFLGLLACVFSANYHRWAPVEVPFGEVQALVSLHKVSILRIPLIGAGVILAAGFIMALNWPTEAHLNKISNHWARENGFAAQEPVATAVIHALLTTLNVGIEQLHPDTDLARDIGMDEEWEWETILLSVEENLNFKINRELAHTPRTVAELIRYVADLQVAARRSPKLASRA